MICSVNVLRFSDSFEMAFFSEEFVVAIVCYSNMVGISELSTGSGMIDEIDGFVSRMWCRASFSSSFFRSTQSRALVKFVNHPDNLRMLAKNNVW